MSSMSSALAKLPTLRKPSQVHMTTGCSQSCYTVHSKETFWNCANSYKPSWYLCATTRQKTDHFERLQSYEEVGAFQKAFLTRPGHYLSLWLAHGEESFTFSTTSTFAPRAMCTSGSDRRERVRLGPHSVWKTWNSKKRDFVNLPGLQHSEFSGVSLWLFSCSDSSPSCWFLLFVHFSFEVTLSHRINFHIVKRLLCIVHEA